MKKISRIAALLALIIALMASLCACAGNAGSESGQVATKTATAPASIAASSHTAQATEANVKESGSYTDKESVALYIHLYGHLPGNYVSKTKARKAGWESEEGNLWDVLPGKSIGGSEFYNDEGELPDKKGRRWTECDIDYEGGYRNAKRIVFSNDGLVYYTDDHYRTFERLY